MNPKTTGAAALLGFAAATAVFAPSSSLLKSELPAATVQTNAPANGEGDYNVDCIITMGLLHAAPDGGCQ